MTRRATPTPSPTKSTTTSTSQLSRFDRRIDPRAKGPGRLLGGRGLLRSADVTFHAELFLIAAVATVLVTRLYLQMTGFPQVGGGQLHIAHMLWGGLLLLLALLLQLLFLDYGLRLVSAIAGGIGLGLFVDELGKFITKDNDYFFQPTIALIYIIFVLLFLVLRFVAGRNMHQVEYLSNVLVRMPRLLQAPDDVDERAQLRDLLRRCDPDDPVVASLASFVNLEVAAGRRSSRSRFLQRLQARMRQIYRRLVRWRWFERLLLAFMLLQALGGLALILIIALTSVTGVLVFFSADVDLRRQISESLSQLGLPGLLELAASLVTAALVILGAFQLRRDRAAAYESFLKATLVSIFFGQVFAFYRDQLWAVWMLVFQIFIAGALHFLIRQERLSHDSDGQGRPGRAAVAEPP